MFSQLVNGAGAELAESALSIVHTSLASRICQVRFEILLAIERR
jgi:hypothetical protein